MKRLTAILIWVLLVLAGIYAVLRFSGMLAMMLDAGQPPQFQFGADATLPEAPNYFISCPKQMLPGSDRQMESPQFNASIDDLSDALIETAPKHDMKLVSGSAEAQHLRFLARSPVLQFPDWVEVKLMAVPTETQQTSSDGPETTFCLFAQSVYGMGDFNKNENRTRAWLADVTKSLDATHAKSAASKG